MIVVPRGRTKSRTDAAIEILNRYKPNLLLLHLLCLDDINHQYGPMSMASLEAMAFLDDRVKRAIFLAWGDGIRSGVRLDRISNLDVAPTIAALLDVELKNVTGHPLDKVLTDVSSSHGSQ
jgi:predicted AlkP superfamily pyrophosphatase or phosphodiesterase